MAALAATNPSAKLTLGYWAIRGLGQANRLLLEYTQSGKWNEVLYEQGGESSGFDKTQWLDVKATLGDAGFDFPNLPHFKDEANGIALTQSVAIMRHVARLAPEKALLGTTLAEMASVDLLVEEVRDLKGPMTGQQYGAGAAADSAFAKERLPGKLALLEGFLAKRGSGDGGKWACGTALPTIADFLLYETLEQCHAWKAGCLDGHPRLSAHRAAFNAIPQLQAFFKAPQHEETDAGRVVTGAGGASFTTAFNNRFAKWRNYGNR